MDLYTKSQLNRPKISEVIPYVHFSPREITISRFRIYQLITLTQSFIYKPGHIIGYVGLVKIDLDDDEGMKE